MPWPMRFGPLPRMTTLSRSVGFGLAGRLVRAVHVRRERLELRGAGVDALVRPASDSAPAAARAGCFVVPRQARARASPKPARFSCAAGRADMPREADHLAPSRRSSTISANCRRNHGSIFVSS